MNKARVIAFCWILANGANAAITNGTFGNYRTTWDVPYESMPFPITLAANALFSPGGASGRRVVLGVGGTNATSGSYSAKFGIGQSASYNYGSIGVGDGGGTVRVANGTTLTTNVWRHVVGVFNSLSNWVVYVNGVPEGTNTTAVAASSAVMVNLCSSPGTLVNDVANGAVAEAAIWDVALSRADIEALAKGFKPSRVRPSRLRFYSPATTFPPGQMTYPAAWTNAGVSGKSQLSPAGPIIR